MEIDDLSKEYDVIVIGTGFTECLVAAASARVGKKVLHLDKNDYYGGPWASFSLQLMQDWLDKKNPKDENTSEVSLEDGERVIKTNNPDRIYTNLKQSWNIPEELDCLVPSSDVCRTKLTSKEDRQTDDKDEEEGKEKEIIANPHKDDHSKELNSKESTKESETQEDPNIDAQSTTLSHSNSESMETEENSTEEEKKSKTDTESTEKIQWCRKSMLAQSRKFNLDMTTKMLYSRGAMVELLISSNVARYVEFKCLTRILTWMNGKETGRLMPVPCSRSDVFKTTSLTLVEKRLLMKFLQSCHNYHERKSEWEEFETQPFINFLKHHKLTPNLIHYVTAAIAMVEPDVLCITGLKSMQLFLTSLGRFGSLPFLFSMYGNGELPQAFCRLCAVFEGTYILRRGIESFIMNSSNNVVGIVSEGDRLKCSHLVLQEACAPNSYLSTSQTDSISRAILITDKSIEESDTDQLTLLRFPKDDEISSAVTVIEAGYTAGICPKGLFVIHMVCKGKDAQNDFSVVKRRLFEKEGSEEHIPKILWELSFNQSIYSSNEGSSIPNLYFCSGPDSALDYDTAIDEARNIFKKIYPEEEFLPRAPDPEEIIFDNGGIEPDKNDGFESNPTGQQQQDGCQDKMEDMPEDDSDCSGDPRSITELNKHVAERNDSLNNPSAVD